MALAFDLRDRRHFRDMDTDFVAALISSARESVMIVSAICAGSPQHCASSIIALKRPKGV